MKKKRDRKPSYTRISSGSGKAYLKNDKRKAKLRLLQNRQEMMEGRQETTEEKVSTLMKTLVNGDLPTSVVIQNLIKSQRTLSNEVAEIKQRVYAKTKEMADIEERTRNATYRIDAQLCGLLTSMGHVADRMEEIRKRLGKATKKNKKEKHDGNKGKSAGSNKKPALPAKVGGWPDEFED